VSNERAEEVTPGGREGAKPTGIVLHAVGKNPEKYCVVKKREGRRRVSRKKSNADVIRLGEG